MLGMQTARVDQRFQTVLVDDGGPLTARYTSRLGDRPATFSVPHLI